MLKAVKNVCATDKEVEAIPIDKEVEAIPIDKEVEAIPILC